MNTEIRLKVAALLVGTALALPALGYEVGTHAWMTNEAYLRSNLAQTGTGSLRERLGFDRLQSGASFDSLLVSDGTEGSCPDITSGSNPLHCYYDNIATDQNYFFRRDPYSPFEDGLLRGLARAGMLRDSEGNTVPASQNQDPSPVLVQQVAFGLGGWLMRGAIREDDLSYPSKADHDDDPRGNIFRVFNHFWDPVHNLDMSAVSGCPSLAPGQVCMTAVKWATGLQDPLGLAQDEDTGRRQHFSYKDATNNYWWALTRQRSKETGGSSFTKADDSRERMFRFATTLRSLGSVVHLLQDMAQPQHSRLDPHSPIQPAIRQIYEPFTEARVLRQTSGAIGWNSPLRSIDNGIPQPEQVPAPSVGCYPTMAFSTARKFYSNQASGDSISTRMGLADYANRGFFTQGTLPNNDASAPVYDFPPRTFYDGGGNLINGYSRIKGTTHLNLIMGGNAGVQQVSHYLLLHAVPDAVAHAGCPDNLPAAYGGLAPLATENLMQRFYGMSSSGLPDKVSYTIEAENNIRMADLLIPRAIAYSTGILNFFFRGQISVLPPNDRVVAVLNQGVGHTMANGYPLRTDSGNVGRILGFESVRLKIRNSTLPILQTSGGVAVVQSTGGTGAQLIAVARYHRNSCYKPDLSGERMQSYALPPALPVDEPICAPGEVVRTDYQEISTSAALPVAAGELDVGTGSEIEKIFDFSANPIPVNATDLFIQVAYRGMMGDDADTVALGTLDAREPTFATFWNNTDYWWNDSNWGSYNSTYPNDSAKDFWVCAGASPVKLVFYYQGGSGTPAMADPVVSSNHPGIVRLGFLFPPPDAPGQRKAIRGTPVAYTIAGIPQIPVQSIFSAGAFRQAGTERVASATLQHPYGNCSTALPGVPNYWCFDTILKRRGQLMGAPAQPLFLEPIGAGNVPPDVDASPAQAAFASVVPLASGVIRFNTDTTLITCPTQPTSLAQPVDPEHLRHIELLEQANELGIGEQER